MLILKILECAIMYAGFLPIGSHFTLVTRENTKHYNNFEQRKFSFLQTQLQNKFTSDLTLPMSDMFKTTLHAYVHVFLSDSVVYVYIINNDIMVIT